MGILSFIFSQDRAKIAGLLIDASIEETHTIDADVTEYPVEDGSMITDHVQVKTPELVMKGVITDAPLGYALVGNIQNLIRSVSILFGGTKRSIDGYNVLVDLQAKRMPFDVYTTLRRYKNMVIKNLSVVRNADQGASVHFSATLKQIHVAVSEVEEVPLAAPVKNIAAKTKDVGQVNPVGPSWIPRAQIDCSSKFSVWDIFNAHARSVGADS